MLVISDSGKGGGRILFAAVFFSVCASVVTTLWVHHAIEHEEEDDRAPTPSRVIIPDAEKDREAETIAELEARVARLEETPQKVFPDPLDTLLNIRSGVVQIAIREQVAALAAKGDEVVPAIVAILNVGRDQEYFGGLEFDGDEVEHYPRLRTALFDVLRRIDTPAARRALLDALGEDASADDCADLMTIYATTNDATMTEGITAKIPGMLVLIRDGEGEPHRALERSLMRWMREQDVSTELLTEVSLMNLTAGGRYHDAFELLLERDPDAACRVVAELAKTDPDLKALMPDLATLGRSVRLSHITALCEFILGRLELGDSGRMRLYNCLPRHPSTVPESPEARKEDAQGLIALLENQLAVETSDSAKRVLESLIQALKATSG
jgi:hypothetical protein